jgi:uncharacterized coiled-coil protein SlyX
MTEKQDTQDNKDIKAEVKPEADDPKTETKAEPTIEELTKQIEELTGDVEKKDAHIKTLQGSLKAAQQRSISKEEFDKRFDDLQAWYADLADDLVTKVSGEYDETKQTRKSYRQQLDEKRQAKPKEETKIDPDVQKFISYINSQGLDFEDPMVKEAVEDDRTPQEALTYLRDKVKNQSLAEIDKRAEEKAKTLFEQMLKDSGLTTAGVGGPSAPSKNLSEMSADELLIEGFKEKAKKK